MYYYGYFRNNDTTTDENGQLFKVVIITNYQNSEYTVGGELLLTDSPFTVEYASDDDDLFKAYKCSTATVGILQTDVNFDLNTTTGNNVLVKLLKYDNEETTDDLDLMSSDSSHFTVEWIGFATPNAYSQNFEKYYDEFDLECQDALSTLQYYNYETLYSTAKFASFSDIVKKWCTFLGTYTNIYITDSITVPTTDSQDILHACFIDERNFFDEDGEAMNVLEVIEQICTYLSITCVPYGDCIYFINYGAIKNGYDSYYKMEELHYDAEIEYRLTNSTITLKHTHDIVADDFASSGTSLSLLSTYNKISVKDDFYPYDRIIPDLSDTDNWVDTSVLDTVGYSPYNDVTVMSADADVTRIDSSDWNGKNIIFIRYRGYENDSTETYNTATINTYHYLPDELLAGSTTPQPSTSIITSVNENKQWNYESTQNYVGTFFTQYQVSKVDNMTDIINSVSFTDSIFIASPQGSQGIFNSDYLPYTSGTQKVLEYKSTDIAVGSDNYIIISGKFKFFKFGLELPIDEGSDVKMDDEMAYQWASLRCGNYWWNGTSWEENPARVVKFQLPLKYDESTNAFGTDIPILNNISYDMRLGSNEGYAVRSPYTSNGDVRVCNITFVLYRPFGVTRDDFTRLTVLSDFDIKMAAKNVNQKISTDDDSETVYSNVIQSGAIEEKDEVELKITTWDGKEQNRSSVLYSPTFYENGFEIFEDRNPATVQFRRLQTVYNKGTGKILTPEEQIIQNNVTQYSTPTTQLNLNLLYSLSFTPYSTLTYHFFENKIFVVDSMSIDYRYNTNTLKITEKK